MGSLMNNSLAFAWHKAVDIQKVRICHVSYDLLDVIIYKKTRTTVLYLIVDGFNSFW